MRVVLQRVTSASVTNESGLSKQITNGLFILIGIEIGDDISDIEYLAGKISRLRVFDDANGVMNLSVMDMNYQILVVSQFTLHAETKKGNRPSYIRAARPEQAIPLYQTFLKELRKITGLLVQEGWFGAHMIVSLINDGPVTIIIDSKNKE